MTDYATRLRDHVTLTCRSVDRIFLQGYVPKLQSVGLVCRFLRRRRGFPIPSSAAFGKIGDAYVASVHRFAKANENPVDHFAKGENKGAFARPLIDAAAKEGGDGKVVLVGIAQEKASVWRSWPGSSTRSWCWPAGGTGSGSRDWGSPRSLPCWSLADRAAPADLWHVATISAGLRRCTQWIRST